MPHPIAASPLGLPGLPGLAISLTPGGPWRLIVSILVLVVGVAVAVVLANRPRSPEPTTWAQAIVGALLVFALMTLAYGVVPHEWLTYASAELNWGEDTFFIQDSAIIPFDIDRQFLADTIAVVIYVVAATVNIWLFAKWQKRPVAEVSEGGVASPKPSRGRRATGTSPYGRPLAAQD